jgi:hypothetical protein
VASPFQYFGDQCCIESLGKLPPKGLGHYIVNVSAISPNSLPRLPGATAANTGSSNITTRRAGRPRTGNAGNGCPQSLSVFFFFLGRGAKTRCSCCRAAAEEPSTQKEASNSGQHAARQAHRRKGPEKALRSAVADAGETGGAGRGSGTAAPVRTNDAGRCAGQFPGRGPARPTYRLRCRTALQGRSRVSGARTGAGGGELSTTFLRHI